jgi:hypothetical protein
MLRRLLPNKRLKLTGAIAVKEAECCVLMRTNYRSTTDAPASGLARSLSAIR